MKFDRWLLCFLFIASCSAALAESSSTVKARIDALVSEKKYSAAWNESLNYVELLKAEHQDETTIKAAQRERELLGERIGVIRYNPVVVNGRTRWKMDPRTVEMREEDERREKEKAAQVQKDEQLEQQIEQLNAKIAKDYRAGNWDGAIEDYRQVIRLLRNSRANSATIFAARKNYEQLCIRLGKPVIKDPIDERADNMGMIGIRFFLRRDSKLPYIGKLYENSSAVAAGLQLGDDIVRIDDVSTLTMTETQIHDLIAGSPGTTVKLTIKRPNSKELTVSCKRLPVSQIADRAMYQEIAEMDTRDSHRGK